MSSSDGKNIVENEFYATPAIVVDALIDAFSFVPSDTFREPCYGDGAIFNKVPLPRMDKSFAEINFNIDYLATELNQVDVIITNPPFSLTQEFIRKALSELKPTGTFACLQRLNYLGSKIRIPFWAEVGFPDKTPVIIPRPRFNNGKSDSCEYAWFIWDFGNRVKIPKGISHLISKEVLKPKKEKPVSALSVTRTKLSIKTKAGKANLDSNFDKGQKVSNIVKHLINFTCLSDDELKEIISAANEVLKLNGQPQVNCMVVNKETGYVCSAYHVDGKYFDLVAPNEDNPHGARFIMDEWSFHSESVT